MNWPVYIGILLTLMLFGFFLGRLTAVCEKIRDLLIEIKTELRQIKLRQL